MGIFFSKPTFTQMPLFPREEKVCLQCVRIGVKPVFSSSDLEPGDQVVIKKDLYEHHAIIITKTVGDTFEVVEVNNSKGGEPQQFQVLAQKQQF